MPRRSRTSSQRAPLANPGEVWLWQSDLKPMFYILRETTRMSRGQMYEGLDVATGMRSDCFMSYEQHNGWERVA